jgi:hypothetical protein
MTTEAALETMVETQRTMVETQKITPETTEVTPTITPITTPQTEASTSSITTHSLREMQYTSELIMMNSLKM